MGFQSSERNLRLTSVNKNQTGKYTLKANTQGCPIVSDSASVSIFAQNYSSVNAMLNDSILCEGDSILLFADSIAGGIYQWSGPSGFHSTERNPIIQNVNLNQAGKYKLSLHTIGCPSVSDSATVSVVSQNYQSVHIQLTDSIFCEGDTIQFTADSIVGGIYHWYGPLGFQSSERNLRLTSVNKNQTGKYTLKANTQGCPIASDSASVSIFAQNYQGVHIQLNDSIFCEGDTIQFAADSIVGGIYHWYGPAGFQSTERNLKLISVNKNQTGKYTLQANTRSCPVVSDSASVSIFAQNYRSVNAKLSDSIVCKGDSILLFTDSIIGGFYQWYGPNGFQSQSRVNSFDSATENQSGIYILNVKNLACPIVSDTIQFLVSNQTYKNAKISVAESKLCIDDTLSLNTDLFEGVAYNWTGPNGFKSNLKNPVKLILTRLDSGFYYLQVSNSICPNVIDSSFVTINNPNIIIQNISICEGSKYKFPSGRYASSSQVDTSTLINIFGCDSILITDLKILPRNYQFIQDTICLGELYQLRSGLKINHPGVFFDTIFSASHCDSIYHYKLIGISRPQDSIYLKLPSCMNSGDGEIEVKINSPIGKTKFEILDLGINESGIFKGVYAGKYTLRVNIAPNCNFYDTIILNNPPKIEVAISPMDTMVCINSPIQFKSLSNYPNLKYKWQPSLYLSCDSCPNPIANPLDNIDYLVTTFYQLNNKICSIDTNVKVTVYPKLYLPNAITNNRDNLNDFFSIPNYFKPSIESIWVQIYNRWGVLVFESNSVDFEWNGTDSDDVLFNDVYFYNLDINLKKGQTHSLNFKGSITVLK